MLASYRDPQSGLLVPIPTGISQEQGDARYVQQDGGVMLADPTVPLGVATKQYADRFVSVPTGFRNVIRNGDMSIAQRGNGPWTVLDNYTADGFRMLFSTGTMSCTRAVQPVGSGSPQLIAAIGGQSGAGAFALIVQPIEDVTTLAGSTVTVSFNAKAASGTPKIAVELERSLDSGAPNLEHPIGSVVITTTMTRYSLTFSLPPLAGQSIGPKNHLRLNIWLSSGSNFAVRSSNIGIQNNTFYITDVQLEAGPVATPFKRLPVQQQLAWCQRYFQRYEDSGTYRAFASGFADGPTDTYVLLPYLQRMRVGPSFTKQGTFVLASGPAIAITDVRLSGQSSVDNATLIVNTTNSGYAQGRACFLQTITSPGIIDFSAEL